MPLNRLPGNQKLTADGPNAASASKVGEAKTPTTQGQPCVHPRENAQPLLRAQPDSSKTFRELRLKATYVVIRCAAATGNSSMIGWVTNNLDVGDISSAKELGAPESVLLHFLKQGAKLGEEERRKVIKYVRNLPIADRMKYLPVLHPGMAKMIEEKNLAELNNFIFSVEAREKKDLLNLFVEFAIHHNKPEVLQTLFENGADINHTIGEFNLVEYAAMYGTPEVCVALVDALPKEKRTNLISIINSTITNPVTWRQHNTPSLFPNFPDSLDNCPIPAKNIEAIFRSIKRFFDNREKTIAMWEHCLTNKQVEFCGYFPTIVQCLINAGYVLSDNEVNDLWEKVRARDLRPGNPIRAALQYSRSLKPSQ